MNLPRETKERQQVALLLRYMHDQHGWTWSAIAKKLGVRVGQLAALRRLQGAGDQGTE